MTSRERVLTALSHKEPDRVPYDLSGSHVTAITAAAYRNIRHHIGMPEVEPQWLDIIQQVVVPHDDFLQRFSVDTRGLFPITSHNDHVYEQCADIGHAFEYHDEWGITHHFPKPHGHWFSIVAVPLADAPPEPQFIDAHTWPDPADPRRIAGLRDKAIAFRDAGQCVMLKGLCAGIFEMAQRIRGMENALLDPFLYPDMADRLFGKLADLKIAFWHMALSELGDVVDVVVEGDDYGTQQSQLLSYDQFAITIRPHLMRLLSSIKQFAPGVRLFMHSCGNVRPFLPDFIDAGVDILNPVHITASDMEPTALKKDFGDVLSFWGGGVDTQDVLPHATPSQIRDHVKKNIDALAPGGGFVFNTVHNIQSDVPPENYIAMWETLQEFGVY